MTDDKLTQPKAVEPSEGFVQGPEVPDQTELSPGFTLDLDGASLERLVEDQRILSNGMVLMGESPPPVDWKAIESWAEGECRDIISPHFNRVCKYDPALDKSNWKNPDLATEPEPAPSASDWGSTGTKGPGVFGMGGGA